MPGELIAVPRYGGWTWLECGHVGGGAGKHRIWWYCYQCKDFRLRDRRRESLSAAWHRGIRKLWA